MLNISKQEFSFSSEFLLLPYWVGCIIGYDPFIHTEPENHAPTYFTKLFSWGVAHKRADFVFMLHCNICPIALAVTFQVTLHYMLH